MTTETRDALRYPGLCDGLDVSQVQTVTDYEAVADAGFLFVTAKASEGLTYCDPKVQAFLKGFSDVGILVNVYGFCRVSQGKPREQARRLFECAGDEFMIRPAVDLESAPDDWTPSRLVGFAEEYIDECLAQSPLLPPELYSYPDFTRRRLLPAMASSTVIARCAWWGAHYMSNTKPWLPPPGFVPYTPPPFSRWTKHQYSGNGGYRVRGIAGDVDRNLFNGDYEALRTYMGRPPRVSTIEMPIVHPSVDFPPRDPPTEE